MLIETVRQLPSQESIKVNNAETDDPSVVLEQNGAIATLPMNPRFTFDPVFSVDRAQLEKNA